MLGFVDSEHPRLTNGEISLEKFQPICDHDTSTSRTDGQTDRQTTCRSNTALASRGKNESVTPN